MRLKSIEMLRIFEPPQIFFILTKRKACSQQTKVWKGKERALCIFKSNCCLILLKSKIYCLVLSNTLKKKRHYRTIALTIDHRVHYIYIYICYVNEHLVAAKIKDVVCVEEILLSTVMSPVMKNNDMLSVSVFCVWY